MLCLSKVCLNLFLFSLIQAFPRINFHLTDRSYHDSVYNCLRISVASITQLESQEILSLCLTESLSKCNIQSNRIDQKLTFVDLRKRNITSEQLYQWSASIDLLEQYEEYLISNQSLMSNQIFYNCTLPRFGPECQYEFVYMPNDRFMTLDKIITKFYEIDYEPTSLTCYVHLDCDRDSTSLCLDWTEICDGYVDCIYNQIDEKFCWQLQINECKQDEYRCENGQCISKEFFFDEHETFECLDQSDGFQFSLKELTRMLIPPAINREDMTCLKRHKNDQSVFTSSCDYTRDLLIQKLMINDRPIDLSNICYFAFSCLFYRSESLYDICDDVCNQDRCKSIKDTTCPQLIIVPSRPLAFGHVHVGYLRNHDDYSHGRNPEYICYEKDLCGGFESNVILTTVNSKTCRRIEDTSIIFDESNIATEKISFQLHAIYKNLYHCNTIFYDVPNICTNSSLVYQCKNSTKCISIYRLCNTIKDCDYGDDENCTLIDENCSPIESVVLFKCIRSKRCIAVNRVGDRFCDCPYSKHMLCEDETFHQCDSDDLFLCGYYGVQDYIFNSISFPTICDGFIELLPILINGTNYTDESECQYWKCNNTYTRCNGFWNCFDGSDEIDCDQSSLIACPLRHHICIKPVIFELICISLEKINDNVIDCLGAIDEPKKCNSKNYQSGDYHFYCDSIKNEHCSSVSELCSTYNCINENEDLFCNISNRQDQYSYCSDEISLNDSYLMQNLCVRPVNNAAKVKIVFYSLGQTTNKELEDEDSREPSHSKVIFEYDFRCHHGYPLRISSTGLVCLCPPSYYGQYCQYQNQRVSFTLQFRVYSDSQRTLFSIIIQLIDDTNERTIHSSKQITYTYIKHCQTKFYFYLTYSTRPKHENLTYHIHIDIYEKFSLNYRASLYMPLNFSFLPVHRISYVLSIPRANQSMIVNCQRNQQCVHGQCLNYAENLNSLIFCRCNRGWTGKDCSIPYECTCSLDSVCIGIEANHRSICICPTHKWGPRCFLRSTINNSICLNNGQSILVDNNIITETNIFCICPKGYHGNRCQFEDAKILVSFDKTIRLSRFMLVHFIQIRKNAPIKNGSTFQSIPLYQQEIVIRWSHEFHIVFTELSDKTYYLINVERNYNSSRIIRKLLTIRDRCGNINEYVNQTIINYHLIRRIKYYHLPCQHEISCFYDRTYFCLCQNFGSERIANCFEFNSTLAHNCFKWNDCQNDGQCIQDDIRCPKTSRCICRRCFYGSLCQFSSSLFDISFDGIIGAYIQPNRHLSQQSSIIILTLILTIILAAFGFINAILSWFVFKNKKTRQVGCGYYLLGSTVTTFLTSLMLILKFSILLITQMESIENKTFFKIQCYSLDYLLQACLDISKWLSGCVATERVFNIIKGAQFNKKKSQLIAKYIIYFLIPIIMSSTIYDPFHRKLVDDDSNDEQKRTWCIVSYSSKFIFWNQFIQMFHFFVPFFINIISALIIIIVSTKNRRTLRDDQSYFATLDEQIRRHRHLIISPIVLVILSLPRLIISFVAGCMQSNDNPRIYLIGYLLSFIPPMATFIVFVLPSKLYKKEFRKITNRYRQDRKANIF